MNRSPYQTRYLPVVRAANALQNQADTILDELHHSIERAKAFRAKQAARAAEKETEARSLYLYGMSKFGMPIRLAPSIPAKSPLLAGAYKFDGFAFWKSAN